MVESAVLGTRALRRGLFRELFCIPVTNRQRLGVVSEALSRAIETELTSRQREILLMHYYDNMTDVRISQTLNVHPSTVCRTRRRAEERLRHALRFYVEFLNCNLTDTM